LVEGVDAQHPAGCGHRELREVEQAPEVRWATHLAHDERLVGTRERLDRRGTPLIGRLSVTVVGDHAIVAVDLRRSERLVDDGHDPAACLPVDSATSCSSHSPKLSSGGSIT
jgi:hypothetical protein